jgi:hypothetical protein
MSGTTAKTAAPESSEMPNRESLRLDPRPAYWKRAHRDWWFWVGLVLTLTVITLYVLRDGLPFLPHRQPRQPLAGAVGQ